MLVEFGFPPAMTAMSCSGVIFCSDFEVTGTYTQITWMIPWFAEKPVLERSRGSKNTFSTGASEASWCSGSCSRWFDSTCEWCPHDSALGASTRWTGTRVFGNAKYRLERAWCWWLHTMCFLACQWMQQRCSLQILPPLSAWWEETQPSGWGRGSWHWLACENKFCFPKSWMWPEATYAGVDDYALTYTRSAGLWAHGGKEVWMKYAKTCLAKICNECDVKTAGVLVFEES